MLLGHAPALARVCSGELRESRPRTRASRTRLSTLAAVLAGAALLVAASAEAQPPPPGGRPGAPGAAPRPGGPPPGTYPRPGGPHPGAYPRPGGPHPGAYPRPGGPPPGAYSRPHARPYYGGGYYYGPRVGVYVGPGWGYGWGGYGWSGWYRPWPYYGFPPAVGAYPYPFPYYSPPVTVVPVPSSPPVYVERGDAVGGEVLEPGYWYYCRNPAGYYPNVQQCPDGWEKVAPQPQNPQ